MICPTCKEEVEMVKRETDEFGRIIGYFSCGHRLLELAVQSSVRTYPITNIKKKGPEKFSRKHGFQYEALEGKRIGKDGKLAFVRQIVDRGKGDYEKFVESEGKIIKNIKGKLTDHK